MTFDDDELSELADLMSEPPGGYGEGRKRGPGGAWATLNEETGGTYQEDFSVEIERTPYRRPKKPKDTIRHGTVSGYNNDECRCDECRQAIRVYRSSRRAANRQDLHAGGGAPRP